MVRAIYAIPVHAEDEHESTIHRSSFDTQDEQSWGAPLDHSF